MQTAHTRSSFLAPLVSCLVLSLALSAIGCGGNFGSGGGGGGAAGSEGGFVLWSEVRSNGDVALRFFDGDAGTSVDLAVGTAAALDIEQLAMRASGDAAWTEVSAAGTVVASFDPGTGMTTEHADIMGVVEDLAISDDGRAAWLAVTAGPDQVLLQQAGQVVPVAATGGAIDDVLDLVVSAIGHLVWKEENGDNSGSLIHFDSTDPPETAVALPALLSDLMIVEVADNGDIVFGVAGDALRHFDASLSGGFVQPLSVQVADVDNVAIAGNGHAAWSDGGIVTLFRAGGLGTTVLNPMSAGNTISDLMMSDAGHVVWKEVEGDTEEVHHFVPGAATLSLLERLTNAADNLDSLAIAGNGDAVWRVLSGNDKTLTHFDTSAATLSDITTVGAGVSITNVSIAQVGHVAWTEPAAGTIALRHFRPEIDSLRTPATGIVGALSYAIADSGDLAWIETVVGAQTLRYFDSTNASTATLASGATIDSVGADFVVAD